MKFWRFDPLGNKKHAMMFNVIGFYSMTIISMGNIMNWLNYEGWYYLPASALFILLAYIQWVSYYESKELYLKSIVDGI